MIYSIALAAYVHTPPRGPAGWAAVIRKGDGVAHYRGHSCHSTEADVLDKARALVVSALGGKPHYVIDSAAPLSEQARADLATARSLARQSALVVSDLLQVIK